MQDDLPWVCDQGGFWGTLKQLTACARCGVAEIKPHNEPRHYAMQPALHMLCDDCFDALPENPDAQ